MARAVGVDGVVRLMGEVAELRQQMRAAQEDLKFMSSCLGSVIANVASLQVGIEAMRSRMEAMREQRQDALEDRSDAQEGRPG